MLCPICQIDLIIAERQGIEIDYCPKCRGVWLDRGELDKLIERTNASFDADMQPSTPLAPDERKRKNEYSDGELPYDYDEHHDKSRRYARNDPRRRRTSFLGDIFDIFD